MLAQNVFYNDNKFTCLRNRKTTQSINDNYDIEKHLLDLYSSLFTECMSNATGLYKNNFILNWPEINKRFKTFLIERGK